VVYLSETRCKSKRCGCEVNNPQGNCCLGNVSLVVEQTIEIVNGMYHGQLVRSAAITELITARLTLSLMLKLQELTAVHCRKVGSYG